MYITCGDPVGDGEAAAAVEPVETGYVPNNPLFSLPLDSPQECSSAICVNDHCNFNDHPSLPLSSLQDCGSCLDHNGVLSQTGLNSSYWNEDMSSFSSLPPLDIEPLPSLFPFSPCGSSYKTERPTHDVADVLLSLKHAAVLKPNHHHLPQDSSQLSSYAQPHQASLSYTVHPQMLVSPNGHHHQSPTQNGGSPAFSPAPSNYYDNGACLQHAPMYPSMSVNVSMNMTMHGYGASEVPVQCSQVQWPHGAQNSASSVNVLYPPLISPGAYPNGATYSFTADFRPQSATSTSSSLNGGNAGLADHVVQKTPSAAPSPTKQYYHHQAPGLGAYPMSKSPSVFASMVKVKSPKEINFEEDDSGDGLFGGDQKPNLCRLCGKTYARPSTLKTHLRTHSGERPYRCPDCNKSFSQAANLTAHMRTHTGQKPFRCPICDRRFSQSSSVTTHMRTHSGERPYRCKACRKAFSDSSTLTKHLRIHSGEKPYQCKLCLLRFSQSGNLNRHMRVHGTNGSALLT